MNYGTVEWLENQFVPFNRYLGDRWGHRWRATQKIRFKTAINLVRDFLVAKNGQLILDIGCGLGDFTKLMISVNPHNQFVGMDISENALRNFDPGIKKQVSLVHAGLPYIPFEKNTFDGVVAMEIFYYLSNEQRKIGMDEVVRVLKPDGWFFFTTVVEKEKTHYFTIDEAISLMESRFMIKKQKFHYSKILSLLESPFVRAFNGFTVFSKNHGKSLLSALYASPAVLAYFFISQQILMESFMNLTKFMFPRASISHLMAIGVKK